MSRLTYKKGKGLLVENNIEYGTLTNVCYQDCVDKLGQLEDIEEELGIDISKVIIFCLKGGFVKSPYENKIIEFKPMVITTVSFEFKHIQLGFPKPNSIADCDFDVVLFKDYGKTWALTKEELE